ncbi:MAG TPA: hypothetical protein VN367_10750 [Chlorobaculum sp.]|nr:hypothetical protein [Chlorobaculum sp.]
MKSLITMVSASLVFAVSGCQRHFVDQPAQLPVPVSVPVAGNAASTTNGATISIDRAIELILKVPEVKEWSEAVQKAGRHPVFMIDDKVETVDGHDYLSVNVYEDAGEYLTRYGTFLGEIDGKGRILVADDLGENDESPCLTLEQWREQRNRPASERGSEGDAP